MQPPQPSAVLKIDASMSILPPPSAQMHTQDMKELAEAFVREEVERQKRTHGVSITKAEQDMMRNAFLAGMQHSPDEKDQSTAGECTCLRAFLEIKLKIFVLNLRTVLYRGTEPGHSS